MQNWVLIDPRTAQPVREGEEPTVTPFSHPLRQGGMLGLGVKTVKYRFDYGVDFVPMGIAMQWADALLTVPSGSTLQPGQHTDWGALRNLGVEDFWDLTGYPAYRPGRSDQGPGRSRFGVNWTVEYYGLWFSQGNLLAASAATGLPAASSASGGPSVFVPLNAPAGGSGPGEVQVGSVEVGSDVEIV